MKPIGARVRGLALAGSLAGPCTMLVVPSLAAQEPARILDAQSILAPLLESYGVSGSEAPVRATVERLLPAWAKAQTDTAGNLWVRVGKGEPAVVFVAHMDEIGFSVSTIREDGSLDLEMKGGFFLSLFEAEPALVHTGTATVPGVFMPRDSVGATPRRTPSAFRVDVGTASRAETEALGIRVGSTVTMPKHYTRLAGTRATGRAMDDRVGCTTLLLALRRLDPARLKHEVIFVFSVREEIGLEGAEAAAAALGTTPRRVHAIDTFVSADSPLEPQAFAVTPIGRGPVVRALDQSAVAPPVLVDSLVALARVRAIPLQVGATNGGNDGSVFAAWGVPDVPIGWPLRYAHSPAEVIDLKDVVNLGEVIRAIAEGW
ncbi:MAG TPA: M20/M25/M40 family metallo-hydrolase [Gemmatimonadales bacterium]